jgi:hypothetical protein
MKPAPWSARYQPMVWPMKVARKAPAMPSTVVRMKPVGVFGPRDSQRAIMPATKPTTMIQMMPLIASPSARLAGASPQHQQ